MLILLALDTQTCLAASSGTFDSFYKPSWGLGFWGWTTIIVFAVAAGVITYFTAGAAAPWMANVGAWIGGYAGLHGIAATNFGLALLGGGSVAAGGLGIAGGVAVLTAISSFATGVVIDYSVDIAMKEWSHSSFVNDSKEMLTLPLPINEDGGDRYKGTCNYLKEHLDMEKTFADPANQNVFSDAIKLYYTYPQSLKQWQREKDYTLLALIHFQKAEYSKSRQEAQNAFKNIEKKNQHKATLPMFIWLTSSLYEPALSKNDLLKYQNKVFPAILEGESNHKLIPLLYAIYLDRIMYMYHAGQVDTDMLDSLVDIIYKHDTMNATPEVLTILTARLLTEIKRTQQDILIIDKNVELVDKKVKAVLEKRFKVHCDCLNLLNRILPLIKKYDKKLPKDSEFKHANVSVLYHSYNANTAYLQQIINGK